MSETRESSSPPTVTPSVASKSTVATATVDVNHNPVESAKELKARFKHLEKGLRNTYARLAMTEQQIFDLERSYLEETRLYGNVLSGWDKYLDDKRRSAGGNNAKPRRNREGDSAAGSDDDDGDEECDATAETPAKRTRTVTVEEHLFSLGSVTSPASKEAIEKNTGKKHTTGVRGRPKLNRGSDTGMAARGTGGTNCTSSSTTKAAREKKSAGTKEREEIGATRGGKGNPSARKAAENEAKKKKRK